MTPVDIIALIFVTMAIIKLIIISVEPASWRQVVKKIYAKPVYTKIFSLCAAVIILYFLLQELTIIQIFASMTFMMALMMIQFAGLGKEVVELTDKFLKNRRIFKKIWLSLTIWMALMLWVLYEILT